MDNIEESFGNSTNEDEYNAFSWAGNLLQEKNFTLFDVIVTVAATTGVLLSLLALASLIPRLVRSKNNFELGSRASLPRPLQRRPSCIYGYGAERSTRKSLCCDCLPSFSLRPRCGSCDSSTVSSVGQGRNTTLHDVSSASGE